MGKGGREDRPKRMPTVAYPKEVHFPQSSGNGKAQERKKK